MLTRCAYNAQPAALAAALADATAARAELATEAAARRAAEDELMRLYALARAADKPM